MLHLNNLAAAQVGMGQYQLAEVGLQKVIQMARSPSSPILLETYRILAEAHWGQGKVDEALRAAQRALSLSQKHEEPMGIGAGRV